MARRNVQLGQRRRALDHPGSRGDSLQSRIGGFDADIVRNAFFVVAIGEHGKRA